MTPQRAIEHAGGSQDKLAAMLGVTRQAVGHWVEKGEIPSAQILRMIELHPEWFRS